MKSPSIRRTLLIRCGIGVGTLLCLLSATIYLLVRQSLYREADNSITQTAALLANQVELENGLVAFEWQEGLGTNNALIPEGLFQFWDDRTGKSTRSPALKDDDLPMFRGPDGSPLVKTIVLPNGKPGRAIGLQVHPFALPEELENMRRLGTVIDPKSLPHTLVVAGNMEPIHRTLKQLRYVLASGTLLTLALGFTLIDHVIWISLQPLNDLTRQMRERNEQQLDSALTMPGRLPMELKGLAGNFDSLLARVAATRQRERDFIRHAAHELRTPIAGLRATTELALSRERDTAAYTGYLKTCHKSAEELGSLVVRLSALARLGDTNSATISLQPVQIGKLVTEQLESLRPLFESRDLHCEVESMDMESYAIGDMTLARIIINNLLDNAASYAPAGDHVKITCLRIKQHVRVAISNSASNLPENLDRLFEPLFRNGIQANDSNSHLGVGLALSLDAAHVMDCELTARRIADGRIEFALTLPVSGD